MTFDRDRAVAILTEAANRGMYQKRNGKPLLPEDEGVLIGEAEKIVTMARQALKIAEEVGKEKVPTYDHILAVLAQAEVVGGSEPYTPITDPEPSEPPPTEPETAPEEQPASTPSPQTLLSAAEDGDREPDSCWADATGKTWIVVGKVDQHHIEVRPEDSDERTIVPIGFLKARVKEEPSTGSSGQSSTVPSGLPSPSATTADESNIPAVPTPTSQPSEPDSSVAVLPSSSPQTDVPLDDDEGDAEYASVLDHATALYARPGLPLPADVHDPPQMPEDISALPDIQLQSLHSRMNACAARAHYLLGIEWLKRVGCQRVRDRHLKVAMRAAREELGKDATVTEVKARAEEDKMVALWIEREQRHADAESAYKTLVDIYGENVSVCSRDWSMRSRDERGS